jgi:hypothetical protein
MKKTIYQKPEIDIVVFQQEGVLCVSDTATFGTGASWGLEEAGDNEGFIL